MEQATWTGETERAARAYFASFPSLEELKKAWLPWEELGAAVAAFLTVESLRSLAGTDVYTRLVALFQERPRMRGRFKSLLSFHEGDKLKDALVRLVTTKELGDPGRRIDAMHLGGLGRATGTEILCLWRPYRFLPQNAASCETLAKLTGLYKRRELAELPYDVFMDLVGTLEGVFRAKGAAAWPALIDSMRDRRYLYFYAFLTDR